MEGVGAVALPVPPLAFAYQSKLVPVAESAVAVAFWQYVIDVVTVGAGVLAITFIVINARGLSQEFVVWVT